MQHLQDFPPDLNQSRRLEVSRLFYSSSSLPAINRSKSVQFVPFLQQRDKMGKLLSSTTNIFKENSSSLSMAQSKLFNEQTTTKLQNMHDQKINRAVGSFFKKIDMESRELLRALVVPKKIMVIAENMSTEKSNECQYDITRGLNQVKNKVRDIVIREQRKSMSPQKFCQQQFKDMQGKYTTRQSNLREIPIKTVRNNSMFEQRQKEFKQKNRGSIKLEKQLYGHRKSNSLLKELKVKLNPEQPDYKRYKQQQQASLKIFEDYDEGHEKFRQKMKQSKQIAYNIKKELQLD